MPQPALLQVSKEEADATGGTLRPWYCKVEDYLDRSSGQARQLAKCISYLPGTVDTLPSKYVGKLYRWSPADGLVNQVGYYGNAYTAAQAANPTSLAAIHRDWTVLGKVTIQAGRDGASLSVATMALLTVILNT